jgi:hypothetical protein
MASCLAARTAKSRSNEPPPCFALFGRRPVGARRPHHIKFECVLCSRQLKEDHGITFTCDGNCGREFGAMDKRFTCVGRGCEFDICKPCMTAHTQVTQNKNQLTEGSTTVDCAAPSLARPVAP